MADDQPAPPPVACANRACRCKETVPSELYTVSVTGRRTQLFVCRACLCGTWVYWCPDRPGVWLPISVDPPSSPPVRAALKGLGYAPPRRGRGYWTDRNGVPVEPP